MIFRSGWIFTAAFFAGTLGAAPAQAKTPASVKKAASAKKAAGPIVLGTTQLAGDFGKVGTTYTIGKSTPINFTLKSAEYSVVPFTVGLNTWQPRGDEKLLVLRYTVHNPMPREQSYSWSDIRFTAVDAKDINHEFIQAVVREGDTQPLSISLKPAQKLDVVTAIVVPAMGVVPKLIVLRESGAPVVRYALSGNVKPLPANVADASDASGATARKEVPAQRDIFYATGVFDTRLDEVAYVDGPLLGRAPGENNRYITTIFTIKNRSQGTQRYVWSDFLPDLRDADGESASYTQALLKATRDESTYGELAPGEEARIRFFFPLPKSVAGKTLKLSEGKQIDARVARVFAFDLSDAPAK
ncbi:MAG: hypothetical protein ABIY70_21860 [Capsulimonas sp.]|uniref:hypothetical protein n=1 Tax=Capsulimonas sp. TaxID=2494211 RepID=UPI003267CB03